jgi:uncharacterized caspase-like protein
MRRLLLLAIVLWQSLFLVVRAEAAERVALIFGNSDYQNAPRLANPANDASDVAAAFERLGFQVKLIKNGTFDVMRRGLLDFAQQAQGADIAVLYFAGHGLEIRDENWLIPVDAELRMDVSASQEAVGLGSIMPIVSKARKLGLVILDACRDNPFGRQMQASQTGRALASRGLLPIEPPNSVLVAFAAKHGTVADDGFGRNSPFTTALLHNLEVPGLEINYLFRNVHDEVFGATGQRQEPYVYGTLSREPIYLKAPAQAAPSLESEAAQTWDAVKGSNSPDVLNKFIERYGTTVHGALARERLAAIVENPPAAAKPETRQAALSPPAPVLAPQTSSPAPQASPPAPQTSPEKEKKETDLSIYDGTWTSVSTGSCGGLRGAPRRVSIRIKNGGIYDPVGTGRIAPDGSVSGHFTSSGLDGRFWGKMTTSSSGVGSWKNELGCAGVWHLSR